MNKPLQFDSGSHWYDCKGEPKAQHDADLRVARKQNLYPSVTTIDRDEFKNPFLDNWKINETLRAAASTFKQPHEDDETYIKRVYEISLEKAKTAQGFGKELHDAIEHYPQLPLNPELIPYLDRFRTWYDANVEHPISREKIMVDHDLGIAGRCDFIGQGRGQFAGQRIIPDWKSQGVKKDEKGRKKPAFYDSWGRQLAAYAVCDAKETGLFPRLPVCISVVIDSTEADDPFVKVWEAGEIISNYEDFVIASYRWFKRKKYFPQPNGMFKLTASVPMPA